MSIRELIEAVEAGTLRDTEWSWGAFPNGLSWDQVAAAYDGSVDAALALMQAVLPGAVWAVASRSHEENDERPTAVVFPGSLECVAEEDVLYAAADTPARALLLAILKAMEAQP